jgi:hypothetical protein
MLMQTTNSYLQFTLFQKYIVFHTLQVMIKAVIGGPWALSCLKC